MEITLQVKLGSIIIHIQEMLSGKGHEFDNIVILQLMNDSELLNWLNALETEGLLPLKR
jgi:hypothetical protein